VGDGDGFGLEGIAQGLRHGFGIAEVAHGIKSFCFGERGMSGACVTDSFARAKGAGSGSIRSPYPGGAQAAGRIHPPKICALQKAKVNRVPKLTFDSTRLQRGMGASRAPDSAHGNPIPVCSFC
jgi:hypothetical protein